MAGRKALAITERQFQVLRVLWERGPLTVRELMEHLPRGQRQPYTTVLGLLQNMERSRLIDHQKEGVTHRYRPVVSRREATGSLVSDFVARFFHGSAEQLILGLVDAQALGPDELSAIEARVAYEAGRVSMLPRDGEAPPRREPGRTKP
jgi:predicted transcriptional regulator